MFCVYIYVWLYMQGVLLGSPPDRSTGSPIHDAANKQMRREGRQDPHPLRTIINGQETKSKNKDKDKGNDKDKKQSNHTKR